MLLKGEEEEAEAEEGEKGGQEKEEREGGEGDEEEAVAGTNGGLYNNRSRSNSNKYYYYRQCKEHCWAPNEGAAARGKKEGSLFFYYDLGTLGCFFFFWLAITVGFFL